MAIEFECTNCGERYRLKDDVAGKKAKCRNPQCGKMMVIPQPKRVTVPPTTPPPDLEAAALAALNEAPERKEDAPAAEVIPMTCSACDHKWTVPLASAGKNVLCPECNHRMKVPVPKKAEAQDWRQGTNQGRPSLAKENFEKPKDVISSEGATVVGKHAWTAGGGADADLEPIPLSRRLKFIIPILLLVGGAAYGIMSWWNGRIDKKESDLITDALVEFEDVNELAAAEHPLFKAVLHMGAGEHAVRQAKTPEDLKKALEHFAAAREALRLADVKDPKQRELVSAERNALVCELAVLTLELGGTEEQVKEQIRYQWLPGAPPGGRKLRINEKTHDVLEELLRTLELVNTAESDFRAALVRRLTRALIKKGQLAVAERLHTSLFNPKEADEGKAWVALEVLHADPTSNLPVQLAKEFEDRFKGKSNVPVPWPVQALWIAVIGQSGKLPPGVAPASSVGVSETARMAHVCGTLLQEPRDGKAAEALAMALKPGDVIYKIRALAMCVEWSKDPGPALEATRPIMLGVANAKQAVPMPMQYNVARMVQVAAAAGRPEPANALADTIPDDGLKTWARADAYRLTLTPENAQPADETTFKVEDRPEKMKAGHAWARLWVARHNARLSGNNSKEKKAIVAWPKPFHAVGLVGIALGLQDRP